MWLGPSLMIAGPPLAFGFSVHSIRYAEGRRMAYLAIVISGLELATWLALFGRVLMN